MAMHHMYLKACFLVCKKTNLIFLINEHYVWFAKNTRKEKQNQIQLKLIRNLYIFK